MSDNYSDRTKPGDSPFQDPPLGEVERDFYRGSIKWLVWPVGLVLLIGVVALVLSHV